MQSFGDKPMREGATAAMMCAIAFLCLNLTLACMYGAFGVLLEAVEARLHVSRELSTLALPLVNLGIALMAPIAGVLAERVSIRLLMLAGALLSLAGYVLLASSASLAAYLLAYGVLIGPALAFTAAVLPSALVTRWYVRGRGRALGLVSMPIGPALAPLLTTVSLQRLGLSATYLWLAGIMAMLLVPLLFVVDFPPSPSRQLAGSQPPGQETEREGGPLKLLHLQDFWSLSIGWAAVSMSIGVGVAHLVPMVRDWGVSASKAASLMSIVSLAGMAGTVAFGWLSERMRGSIVLALLCCNSALCWAAISLQPPYAVLLIMSALLGFHGGGVVPVFAMALSQRFGRAQFARAFGLGHLIGLPLNLLGVPLAATIYTHTGSYTGAVLGLASALLITGLLTATAARPSGPAPKPDVPKLG